jgi:short-subunit dehydrogenase
MQIDGSFIVVTGASSGIGAALAPLLARRGATVGLVARREDRLHTVLASCREHAPDSRFWVADLGDLGRAEEVALEAWDAFGSVDCLVNNAGIPKRTPVARLTGADIAHVMDVNFHSPVRMTLALLPHWLARGAGCVVNVASLGGRIPIAHEAAYCASKYALSGWSEVMAVDLYGTGIEVKLMHPGPIATEIWDQPGNDAAAFSGPFVSAADCATAIADGIEDDGFEYYVPAEFPGGTGTQHAVVVNKTADPDAFVRLMGQIDLDTMPEGRRPPDTLGGPKPPRR